MLSLSHLAFVVLCGVLFVKTSGVSATYADGLVPVDVLVLLLVVPVAVLVLLVVLMGMMLFHDARSEAVKTAIVWDVATGRPLQVFRGHVSHIWSVAFSRDGKQVLTGSGDNTAILWDAATGQKARTLHAHISDVVSVAFSPDGKQVLTGSRDRTAILWKRSSGRRLQTLHGHKKAITSVSFSPDQRWILTGSLDKTAILWDTRTGQKDKTLRGHTAGITCLSFCPDSQHAITGSRDGSAILWNALTGRRSARLVNFEQDHDWLVLTPEGYFDGSSGGCKHIRWSASTDPFPVHQYQKKYRRHDLVSTILALELGTSVMDDNRDLTFSELQKKYVTNVVRTEISLDVVTPPMAIRARNATDCQVAAWIPILVAELNMYPDDLARRTAIARIVLCDNGAYFHVPAPAERLLPAVPALGYVVWQPQNDQSR